MKLEIIALAIIVLFGALWGVTFITGLIVAVPFGVLGLVPVAIVGGLFIAVLVQRLTNREDQHYSKNIDQ